MVARGLKTIPVIHCSVLLKAGLRVRDGEGDPECGSPALANRW